MVNTSETKNEKLKNNEAIVQVMKQPKTFAQQVEIIKEKGFIAPHGFCDGKCTGDQNTGIKLPCIGFLKQANYYRLSAYFLPFRKKDGTYFSNINFHRIQRIYEFDSRLRGVLFNYIEKVELYLRTQLAYYSGYVHGALGYMDGAIYNDRHNHEKFVKLLNVCIEENKSTSVVQHHKEKYGGNFPIWVIVEFFSMGMLSYFYADLQSGDQKYLAKELYGTSVACLKSWLRCITELRNRCAHYSRLYYWSFPALPKMPRELEISPNRKLFSQILVLKLLYSDKKEWINKVLIELKAIIEEYENDISLRHIGFPEDWYEQLEK